MTDKGYLEKIQVMTDADLERELVDVFERQTKGYEMMKSRDPFSLLAEASVKLCDEAIDAIKLEQKKRKGNSL